MARYPVIALRGLAVFPGVTLPLQVGRQLSVAALTAALEQSGKQAGLVALFTQKDTKQEDPRQAELYEIGTLARVKQAVRESDGTVQAVIEGLQRIRLSRTDDRGDRMDAVVRAVAEKSGAGAETEALLREMVQHYEGYVRLSQKPAPPIDLKVVDVEDPGRLADLLAANLSLKLEDKLTVLQAVDLADRLRNMSQILLRETEMRRLEQKINRRVRKQMEKTQREYYLREQIKAIQSELGEGGVNEAADYRERIDKKQLPEEMQERALREVDRLEKMPAMTAEAVVVRTYLDWLLSLPWTETTEDNRDIDKAEAVLDADHFGLADVKERILEHLAVQQQVGVLKGPILCLVGPPGVGKTSLARSVARALDRKFVRVSLGGVRDEAEIRGHRRTYVGSMPGRILQGMRQAGSRNPVFLLDEIDKMTADFRGDPASALLEVLDPEQNGNFSDHYLEGPYDLSQVLFITTANSAYRIPWPLLDRMELIRLEGYTEEEKVEIARRHLLTKQLEAHGLQEQRFHLSEGALREIIRRYTREAGVRQLERQLAALCRKATRRLLKDSQAVRITLRNLENYLGKPRYRYGTAEVENQVGVALGLGWTETGGDTMAFEVSAMPGKGGLLLTGKLGDTMKESAQAAFSYVRSRAGRLGLDPVFHERLDIHVHVPEGAVPKDGPSAGITMATALTSALTGIRVRRDVAMTGEITLRGRVLPVGGVKEKVMAAHRAGVRVVILPDENRRDYEEIPERIRRELQFVWVEHVDEVLPVALEKRLRGRERDADQEQGLPPGAVPPVEKQPSSAYGA